MRKYLFVFIGLFLWESCGAKGHRGPRGARGYVVYPHGKGYTLITDCEYQWEEGDFKYKTFFSVRESEDRTFRMANICNIGEGKQCKDEDYVTIKYPSSSVAFSTPTANDGLVSAEMVGVWQTKLTNKNGGVRDIECNGASLLENNP